MNCQPHVLVLESLVMSYETKYPSEITNQQIVNVYSNLVVLECEPDTGRTVGERMNSFRWGTEAAMKRGLL